MTIMEMIAEWRNGCTNAGHRAASASDRELGPGYCRECTEALIHAIESKVKREGEGDVSGHDELMDRLRIAYEAAGLLRATRDGLVAAVCDSKLEWFQQWPADKLKRLEHAIDAAQLRPPMTKAEACESIENLKRMLALRQGRPFPEA